ncbi:MAG: type II toxin-antitoxin system VapC family toxin [bacterium]|nr:type II toxin-antitoxin system VapC family toxin [bacterium]
MKYLLDTDVTIFALKKSEHLELKCLQVGLDNIAISVITQAELTFGAYNSQRIHENLRRIEQFCQTITILPISSQVVNTFGQLKAKGYKKGEPLEDFDIMIASTALSYNLTLATGNVVHFKKIPDLQIENWIRK